MAELNRIRAIEYQDHQQSEEIDSKFAHNIKYFSGIAGDTTLRGACEKLVFLAIKCGHFRPLGT